MMKTACAVFVLFLGFSFCTVTRAEIRLLDYGKFLSEYQAVKLNDELSSFSNENGISVFVASIPFAEPISNIEKYKQMFKTSREISEIGGNEILLLINPSSGEMSIEIGKEIGKIVRSDLISLIKEESSIRSADLGNEVVEKSHALLRVINSTLDKIDFVFIFLAILLTFVVITSIFVMGTKQYSRQAVLVGKAGLTELFREVEKLSRNPDTKRQDRHTFSGIRSTFVTITALSPSSEDVNWRGMQCKMDQIRIELLILLREMEHSIFVAEEARREGPRLLEDVLEGFRKFESLVVGDSPSQLKIAKKLYLRFTLVLNKSNHDWVVAYPHLREVMDSLHKIESELVKEENAVIA